MRYKSIHFLFIAWISTVPSSRAQHLLTLQDALQYALKNSKEITKAKLDILAGDYKIKEVRAAALPTIDGTSTMSRSIQAQKFLLPAEIAGGTPGEFIAVTAGTKWSAMSQVQLNQQLFNQTVFTGLKASKATKEFYQVASQVAEENVLQLVATNYYQVIITKEQLKVIDANLERVKELEKIVSKQLELGLAKRIDLDRVKVNKGNLLAQREEILNAVQQQENLLKYYMGMPITAEIIIPETGVSEIEYSSQQYLAENSEFTVEKLKDFQVLKKQEELLNFQRKAYLSEYYPSLSLGANYMYNSQSNNFNLYSNNALGYAMSSATLTLKIPIFDGGARSAKVKQAEIEIEKLQEDIKDSSNGLRMAYENAKIQIRNSLTTIQTQQENKLLAEEVYKSTENNYHNGLASLTDLLTAETELVSAQNSYNTALLNYKVAEIELIKSNGNIQSLILK